MLFQPRTIFGMADDREARAKLLKLVCEAAVPRIREEQPEWFKKYQQAHADDIASWSFTCSRWGDFLAVYIQRGPVRAREPDWYAPQKVCATINLGQSQTISVQDGHGPDSQGRLTIHGDPPKSYQNEAPVRGAVVNLPPPASSYDNCYHSDCQYLGAVTIDGCARPAEDDRIFFAGPNVTIPVPFGLGQDVYAAILAELRTG